MEEFYALTEIPGVRLDCNQALVEPILMPRFSSLLLSNSSDKNSGTAFFRGNLGGFWVLIGFLGVTGR